MEYLLRQSWMRTTAGSGMTWLELLVHFELWQRRPFSLKSGSQVAPALQVTLEFRRLLVAVVRAFFDTAEANAFLAEEKVHSPAHLAIRTRLAALPVFPAMAAEGATILAAAVLRQRAQVTPQIERELVEGRLYMRVVRLQPGLLPRWGSHPLFSLPAVTAPPATPPDAAMTCSVWCPNGCRSLLRVRLGLSARTQVTCTACRKQVRPFSATCTRCDVPARRCPCGILDRSTGGKATFADLRQMLGGARPSIADA